MLVHDMRELLREGNLVLLYLVGARKGFPDLRTEVVLLRVRFVAAVRLDPFLNLRVAILYKADTFVVLSIFVGNFFVDEADLLRKILHPVDPVVQDQAGIQRLGLRHSPDEVDGQIVSGHDVNLTVDVKARGKRR
jgi:hypothetical protein